MTGTLFNAPRYIPVSNRGIPRASATLTFYQAGTSTLVTIYATSALSGGAALSNPVSASTSGEFPAIYLDPATGYDYKVVLKTASGAQVWAEDNVPARTGGAVWGGTAGGTADAITLTPAEPIGAYSAGLTVRFLSAAANTGAATLAVSGLAAKSITKNGATALAANDILADAVVTVVYDGTQFQMTSAMSAAQVLALLLTVDGAASGLDADLLDGLSSTDFAQLATTSAFTGTVRLSNNLELAARTAPAAVTGMAVVFCDASDNELKAVLPGSTVKSLTLPEVVPVLAHTAPAAATGVARIFYDGSDLQVIFPGGTTTSLTT